MLASFVAAVVCFAAGFIAGWISRRPSAVIEPPPGENGVPPQGDEPSTPPDGSISDWLFAIANASRQMKEKRLKVQDELSRWERLAAMDHMEDPNSPECRNKQRIVARHRDWLGALNTYIKLLDDRDRELRLTRALKRAARDREEEPKLKEKTVRLIRATGGLLHPGVLRRLSTGEGISDLAWQKELAADRAATTQQGR